MCPKCSEKHLHISCFVCPIYTLPQSSHVILYYACFGHFVNFVLNKFPHTAPTLFILKSDVRAYISTPCSSDIKAVIKQLKNGNVPEADNIAAEMLKMTLR